MTGKRRVLKLALVMLLSLAASLCYAGVPITLNTGWNLISLPEQMLCDDITVITECIATDCKAVWTIEEGEWLAYFPGHHELSDLTSMKAGKAYWIEMNAEAVLYIDGPDAASCVSLTPGWNFIGCNAAAPREIADIFDEYSQSIISIWSYVDGEWKAYLPQTPGLSDFSELQPGKGYWVNVSEEALANFGYTLNNQTLVLSETTLDEIQEVTHNEVFFHVSSAPDYVVGDIIVAPSGHTAPNGLLRRITGVSTQGDQVVYETEEASLTDVIQEGVISFSHEVTTDDVNRQTSHFSPGVRMMSRRELEPIKRDDYIGFIIDHEISSDVGTIQTHGEVFIKNELVFNLKLSEGAISYFMVGLEADEYSEISVHALSGEALSDEWSYELARLDLFTHVYWIGWLPVLVGADLTFTLHASGEIVAEATTVLHQESAFLAGLEYEPSNGFSPVRSFNNSFFLEGDAHISSSAKAGIEAGLEVFIYELGGPYMSIMGYGEFLAEADMETLDWGIYAGLDLNLGVALNPAFEDDFEWDPMTIPVCRFKIFPEDMARLSGYVNGSDGALQGVMVSAFKDSQQVAQPVYTDASGFYTLELPPGSGYSLTYVKSGHNDETMRTITADPADENYLPTVFLSVSGLRGSCSGNIHDAVNGEPIANAKLTFRMGYTEDGTSPGGIAAIISTDANGHYNLQDMQPGYYTAEINANGYIKGTLVVLCRGGENAPQQNTALSPIFSDNNWRIILTWGENPSDLDAHLTGPIEGSSTRFHLYFPYAGEIIQGTDCTLDRDDVDSYGPETVTIPQTIAGTYRYSVHDFSNRNSSPSDALSESDALVQIVRGSEVFKTYRVPSHSSGTLWTVFEIRNGQVVDINNMSYEHTPGNVTAVRRYVNPEAKLFTRLPDKQN